MFLRSYKRRKNGKWHEYFSVVENRRLAGGKRVQRTVLYHIFVDFLAYCLMVTLREKLRFHAPGLTARDVLEKLATITMIDVRIPTADGRMLQMRRYSQPEIERRIILEKLKIDFPAQPPPKVYSHQLNSKVCGGN